MSLLSEAWGQQQLATKDERAVERQNALGSRYVRLVYGIAELPLWLRLFRWIPRLGLLFCLLEFSFYGFFVTLRFGNPGLLGFLWSWGLLVASYSAEMLAGTVQILYEWRTGIPALSLRKRRQWGYEKVIRSPEEFLQRNREVERETDSSWWYGNLWFSRPVRPVSVILSPFFLLGAYILLEQKSLTVSGEYLLLLAIISLVLFLFLGWDTLIRFAPWRGASPSRHGEGLMILLADIRVTGTPHR